jgi:hypothetical protein
MSRVPLERMVIVMGAPSLVSAETGPAQAANATSQRAKMPVAIRRTGGEIIEHLMGS